jgi:hypothetical protein
LVINRFGLKVPFARKDFGYVQASLAVSLSIYVAYDIPPKRILRGEARGF